MAASSEPVGADNTAEPKKMAESAIKEACIVKIDVTGIEARKRAVEETESLGSTRLQKDVVDRGIPRVSTELEHNTGICRKDSADFIHESQKALAGFCEQREGEAATGLIVLVPCSVQCLPVAVGFYCHCFPKRTCA